MRDALVDLVQENRLSVLRLEDPKCPMGVCLQKHGYAAWAPYASPAKWRITPLGYRFMETRLRVLAKEETR